MDDARLKELQESMNFLETVEFVKEYLICIYSDFCIRSADANGYEEADEYLNSLKPECSRFEELAYSSGHMDETFMIVNFARVIEYLDYIKQALQENQV